MHKRLYKFLEQEACFYILQIGFCLNCSTNNALMSVIENIQTQLDNNKYTAGVFADLEKAFDTVDHDTFIEKVNHCGVRGVAKDWFISYLKGRRQFVVIENETSSTQETLTGVPQGSVLGPLLSLIYINDLNNCIQFSKAFHFADDTNIMQSNISLEVLAKQMNKDLLNLSYWLIFRPTGFKIDPSIKFKL